MRASSLAGPRAGGSSESELQDQRPTDNGKTRQDVDTTLNFDVALSLVRFCSRTTIRTLMQTCRALYEEGVRCLLADVTIHGAAQLGPFLAFLNAGDDVRFRSLCALRLSFQNPQSPPPEVVEQLLRAIPKMTALESLEIDCSNLLWEYPALNDAFAALRSLRNLKAVLWNAANLPLVTHAQSPIRSIHVDSSVEEEPGVLFQSFSSTLEEIWYFQRTAGLSTPLRLTTRPPDRPPPIYPKVWKMNLGGMTPPRTIEYVKTFPNLTHLILDLTHPYSDLDGPRSEALEILEQHRMANREDASSAPYWTHLQCYRGYVADLYLLAIRCPIHEVDLHELFEDELELLAAVLEDVRPKHLTLRISHRTLNNLATTRLVMSGAFQLDRLHLTVKLKGDPADINPYALTVGAIIELQQVGA
ncbi:hypothetical protein BD413DRAFT_561559 [Trametes elegans]|nr:hypothetical protein BD413DRAFT_561559 [Trametes elegans]